MFAFDRTVAQLQARVLEQQKSGNAVSGVATAFPKHPPPQGIAYSMNFARCLRDGPFAVQTRD